MKIPMHDETDHIIENLEAARRRTKYDTWTFTKICLYLDAEN